MRITFAFLIRIGKLSSNPFLLFYVKGSFYVSFPIRKQFSSSTSKIIVFYSIDFWLRKFRGKVHYLFSIPEVLQYENSPHLTTDAISKNHDRTSTMVKHALCGTLKVSPPPASILDLHYYYSGYMKWENSEEAACTCRFLPTEVWSVPSFFKPSKWGVQSFWRDWNHQRLPPYYCLV